MHEDTEADLYSEATELLKNFYEKSDSSGDNFVKELIEGSKIIPEYQDEFTAYLTEALEPSEDETEITVYDTFRSLYYSEGESRDQVNALRDVLLLEQKLEKN